MLHKPRMANHASIGLLNIKSQNMVGNNDIRT